MLGSAQSCSAVAGRTLTNGIILGTAEAAASGIVGTRPLTHPLSAHSGVVVSRAETPSPDEVYRLEHVGTARQRGVFALMQAVFLVALLGLSGHLLTLFLTGRIGSTAIATVLVVYGSFLVFWQIAYVYRILAMKRAVLVNSCPPSSLRLAMATTIVPSREFDLLRGKLEGMVRVDPCGNAVDCWVLDEEDDPRVRAMIDEFNRRDGPRGARLFHFTRKHSPWYNEAPRGRRFRRFQARQKGGNINAWLDSVDFESYDVITFLDLDHVPKPEFYRKVLPYFRDPGVGFVQGPESFSNRDENFITRAASLERDIFFGLIHRSYLGLGMPIIIGSHTTFRRETIRALGGSYPVHLTEDYLIMLKLRSLQQRGVFVDDVLAVGELPSTWSAYLSQQNRWASGGLDLLLRYFLPLARTYTPKENLFSFVLLNYYAWGTFFLVSKVFLYACLLAGLALHVEPALIVGILAFTVVSAVANHLWERQFFIEAEKKSFLVENAVMNNFLGGLYCLALFKAAVVPNTPFMVTAKSGTRQIGGGTPYVLAACALLALEVAGMALALYRGPAETAFDLSWMTRNVFLYPLVLSLIGNVSVLVFFRRMEQARVGAADACPQVLPVPARSPARLVDLNL